VGLKLDRHELTGSRLLAGVVEVLADHARYRLHCEPLSRALAVWKGGEQAADLLEGHFAGSDREYRVDPDGLVRAEHFERYLAATTPPELHRGEIARLLHRAMVRGMPFQADEGQLLFDEFASWNWLHDREPAFFQKDYAAQRTVRKRFHVLTGDAVRMRRSIQRYHLRYTLRLEPGRYRGRRVKIFLPVPLVRTGQQDPVRLVTCWPTAMGTTLAPRSGFYYGHVVSIEDEAPLEFGYAAEISVHERCPRLLEPAASPPEDRRWLDLPKGFSELPEVVQLRSRLCSDPGNPEERAREIYDLLLSTTRFQKTRDRGSGLAYSTQRVLRERVGHCVSLSYAYIALCRREGIPAREVTGALLGYAVARDKYVRQGYCEPVFGHTWVEIWLAKWGWIPVEFHGIDIGSQADTGANVVRGEVRSWMRREGPVYAKYYFGHTDHQRVVCSNSSKTIPPFLVENVSSPPGHRERWRHVDDLLYTCRMEVTAL